MSNYSKIFTYLCLLVIVAIGAHFIKFWAFYADALRVTSEFVLGRLAHRPIGRFEAFDEFGNSVQPLGQDGTVIVVTTTQLYGVFWLGILSVACLVAFVLMLHKIRDGFSDGGVGKTPSPHAILHRQARSLEAQRRWAVATSVIAAMFVVWSAQKTLSTSRDLVRTPFEVTDAWDEQERTLAILRADLQDQLAAANASSASPNAELTETATLRTDRLAERIQTLVQQETDLNKERISAIERFNEQNKTLSSREILSFSSSTFVRISSLVVALIFFGAAFAVYRRVDERLVELRGLERALVLRNSDINAEELAGFRMAAALNSGPENLSENSVELAFSRAFSSQFSALKDYIGKLDTSKSTKSE